MIAYVIPGEIIVAAISTQIAAVVAIAALVSRVRERIARLEEWVRLTERNQP